MDSAAAQDAEQIGNQFAAAFASFDQIDKRDEAGILSTHRTCKDLLCQLGLTFVDLAADLQHDGRITEGIRNTFVRLDGDGQTENEIFVAVKFLKTNLKAAGLSFVALLEIIQASREAQYNDTAQMEATLAAYREANEALKASEKVLLQEVAVLNRTIAILNPKSGIPFHIKAITWVALRVTRLRRRIERLDRVSKSLRGGAASGNRFADATQQNEAVVALQQNVLRETAGTTELVKEFADQLGVDVHRSTLQKWIELAQRNQDQAKRAQGLADTVERQRKEALGLTGELNGQREIITELKDRIKQAEDTRKGLERHIKELESQLITRQGSSEDHWAQSADRTGAAESGTRKKSGEPSDGAAVAKLQREIEQLRDKRDSIATELLRRYRDILAPLQNPDHFAQRAGELCAMALIAGARQEQEVTQKIISREIDAQDRAGRERWLDIRRVMDEINKTLQETQRQKAERWWARPAAIVASVLMGRKNQREVLHDKLDALAQAISKLGDSVAEAVISDQSLNGRTITSLDVVHTALQARLDSDVSAASKAVLERQRDGVASIVKDLKQYTDALGKTKNEIEDARAELEQCRLDKEKLITEFMAEASQRLAKQTESVADRERAVAARENAVSLREGKQNELESIVGDKIRKTHQKRIAAIRAVEEDLKGAAAEITLPVQCLHLAHVIGLQFLAGKAICQGITLSIATKQELPPSSQLSVFGDLHKAAVERANVSGTKWEYDNYEECYFFTRSAKHRIDEALEMLRQLSSSPLAMDKYSVEYAGCLKFSGAPKTLQKFLNSIFPAALKEIADIKIDGYYAVPAIYGDILLRRGTQVSQRHVYEPLKKLDLKWAVDALKI